MGLLKDLSILSSLNIYNVSTPSINEAIHRHRKGFIGLYLGVRLSTIYSIFRAKVSVADLQGIEVDNYT